MCNFGRHIELYELSPTLCRKVDIHIAGHHKLRARMLEFRTPQSKSTDPHLPGFAEFRNPNFKNYWAASTSACCKSGYIHLLIHNCIPASHLQASLLNFRKTLQLVNLAQVHTWIFVLLDTIGFEIWKCGRIDRELFRNGFCLVKKKHMKTMCKYANRCIKTQEVDSLIEFFYCR